MGNALINPKTLGSIGIGKILFADVHTVQQTESVKFGLPQKDTIPINVPFAQVEYTTFRCVHKQTA